jgi:hypothetical protein
MSMDPCYEEISAHVNNINKICRKTEDIKLNVGHHACPPQRENSRITSVNS